MSDGTAAATASPRQHHCPARLVTHIRFNGNEDRFYEKRNTYFDEDGFEHWSMRAPLNETIIINVGKKSVRLPVGD